MGVDLHAPAMGVDLHEPVKMLFLDLLLLLLLLLLIESKTSVKF